MTKAQITKNTKTWIKIKQILCKKEPNRYFRKLGVMCVFDKARTLTLSPNF